MSEKNSEAWTSLFPMSPRWRSGRDEAGHGEAEFSTEHDEARCRQRGHAVFWSSRKPHSIVVIASVSGREVDVAATALQVFKAALIHYAKGIVVSTRGRVSIRVNALSPGNTYFPGGVWEKIEQGNPELFKQAMALNPTSGGWERPEEMALARSCFWQARRRASSRGRIWSWMGR